MNIGMIVAMSSEVAALLEKMGTPAETESPSGFEVMAYSLGKNMLYVVKSGVGEIYAASAAQMLISQYGVKMIVNFGICGGLTDDMALKKAVVVEKAVHYAFDLSQIDDCEVGQYPGYPDVYLPASEELVNLALEADPSLEKVICASADKFVGDPVEKRELNRRFGAKICEMEAAGIILTANRAGVPVLLIKAVSDSASAVALGIQADIFARGLVFGGGLELEHRGIGMGAEYAEALGIPCADAERYERGAVSCGEILSALLDLPAVPFVELGKALVFKLFGYVFHRVEHRRA